MKILVDEEARGVFLTVPRKIYSDDAVRVAAHVFADRAHVFHKATGSAHELTLAAKRRDIDGVALEILGGEFLNELLNQEYRFLVARFNRKIADLISAQTLLAAMGEPSRADVGAVEGG